MPAAVQSLRPTTLDESDSPDAFSPVLDVVCREFVPGVAPLTTEQLRAAALFAEEAWHQHCGAAGWRRFTDNELGAQETCRSLYFGNLRPQQTAPERLEAERVNDFATPGYLNLVSVA